MKKTYLALQPLSVNSIPVAIGETVDLTEKEAKQLLEIGHIELTDQKPVELTEAQKLEAVKNAILGLDLTVESNFTKGGVPNTSVLTAAVGFEVSAALRDAVWAEVQAEIAAAAELAAKATGATNELAGNAGAATA